MHIALFPLWIGLAAGWLSGIAFIARLIGGYQYIQHMGQARTVTMLALAGALCFVSGCALLWLRRLPTPLKIAIAVVAGIHLLGAVGFLLGSTTGIAGVLLIPFRLIAAVLPTKTFFVGMPAGNGALLLLPIGTLLLLLASPKAIKESRAHTADA
jgi:hypothetical protein